MRVILVDDEPIALEVIEASLSIYDDIQILESFTDPIMALEKVKSLDPDLVFLDIEMGPINGLEIANDFIREKNSIEIVFVTAYSKYAIEAFEFNAIDYILKPPQKNRLDKTIERLRERFNGEETIQETNQLKVYSFGNFEVRDNMDQPLKWRTQKTKELFALLVVEKKVSRDMVLESIFSDKDLQKATTILHTTVYQLRKRLTKLGFEDGIIYSNGKYELNLDLECDIQTMDRILGKKIHSEEDIRQLIKIYKGDFLEYESYFWAMDLQQKYKLFLANVLLNYVRTQLRSKVKSPLMGDSINLLYKIEPYSEEVASLVIDYLGGLGHMDRLRKFFKEYKDKLWEELSIQPGERTQKLYEKYW